MQKIKTEKENNMSPEIKNIEAMKLVGCSEKINLSEKEFSGIGKAWERFFLSMDKIPNTVQNDKFWGITTGLYQAESSYIASKLVTEIREQNEFTSFDIPSQQFAIFKHKGNPMKMGGTVENALKWLTQSEFELNGNFNLEMYDSRCNPEDPDGYIVDLLFPVRKK